MLRIDLYGNLQEMKMPNRPGRASAFNGQLSLDWTAYATKQSVIACLFPLPKPKHYGQAGR
jgi:hypothetical protein